MSQKQLDSTKGLVTNFQLKSAKSSKILLKKYVIFNMIKRNLQSYTIYEFFVLHSLSICRDWKCRSWPTHVSVNNFRSVNILTYWAM